jgi:hypothetical protein
MGLHLLPKMHLHEKAGTRDGATWDEDTLRQDERYPCGEKSGYHALFGINNSGVGKGTIIVYVSLRDIVPVGE